MKVAAATACVGWAIACSGLNGVLSWESPPETVPPLSRPMTDPGLSPRLRKSWWSMISPFPTIVGASCTAATIRPVDTVESWPVTTFIE